ncbi:MAG TPA: lysophospholipid acyltransferase family protein [Candidatus Binatia bacterium]|nr:lysophospholipid acyltransferase family protein [Candidatus Binatia bacterium]
MRVLLRAGLTLLGHLPLALLHAVGAAAGWLLWAVPNRARYVTLLHVERCLGLTGAERDLVARQSLLHFGRAALEAPAVWFGSRSRLLRWIDDGVARTQLQSLARERGLILLGPHLGSWELAGMFCAASVPLTSLYKPQPGVMDDLILQGRARLGARLAPSTTGGVKTLLEALRRRETIGILPDQDPPAGSGVFAPLFGISAHTTELVSKLAARTGAPVWFCWGERLPRGAGFRIHLREAPADITDPHHGPAALNRGIESVVREMPEQYWWGYRRYRRRPQGESRLYEKGR